MTILNSKGILFDNGKRDRVQQELIAKVNPENKQGSFADAVKGADVLIGCSAPGVFNVEAIKTMNDKSIVFAMANPVPEIMEEEAKEKAMRLLKRVGLEHKADAMPDELSGGQQQRVAIARALAVKPKMMLFDEPTSALDPELRHEVLKVMQDLAEEGMTMVIVTHEIGFAEKVASRLIFIDKGRIAEDGNPQELVKNPPSQRLQEFLQHVS